MNPLFRWLLRLVFLVCGMALAAWAGEALVWRLDPYGAVAQSENGALYRSDVIAIDPTTPRLFRHQPNLAVPMRGHLFRTDSRGLRGPELAHPKPSGTRRLLFLGDSVVLGWGVADEDTFVARIAPELTERTGETWETVNGGHLLHDTSQELGVLEEVGFLYEPDLVILVFVENDLVSTRQLFESKEEPAPEQTEEAKEFLERVQMIAQLEPYAPASHAVLQHLYVKSHPAGQTGSTEHAEAMGFSLEEAWEVCKVSMRHMHQLTRERDLPFAVLDYQRGGRLSEELSAFCAAEGIPYSSIAFTEEERALGLENSPADPHANPRGHGILVEHILAALDEHALLDEVPKAR